MKFFTINAFLFLFMLNLDVHTSKFGRKLPPITYKVHCALDHMNSSVSEGSHLDIWRYRQGQKGEMVARVYSSYYKGQNKMLKFGKGLNSSLVSGALEFGKGYLIVSIIPPINEKDKEWLHDEYQCVASDFKTETLWKSGLVSFCGVKFDKKSKNCGKKESDPPGLVLEVDVFEGETSAFFRDCNKTPNWDQFCNRDSKMKLDKSETENESLLSFLNDSQDTSVGLKLNIPPVKYKLHCTSNHYNSSLSKTSYIYIQSSRPGQVHAMVARVNSGESKPRKFDTVVTSVSGSLEFGKGFLEVTICLTNIKKIGDLLQNEYQCVVGDFKPNTEQKSGSVSLLDPEGDFRCGKMESNPPELVLEMEGVDCLTAVITAPFCDVDQYSKCHQHTVKIKSMKKSRKTQNILSFLNRLSFVLICLNLSSSDWFMTSTLPSSSDFALLKPEWMFNCSFLHNISIYQCKIIPNDEEGTTDWIWVVVVLIPSVIAGLAVLIFICIRRYLQKKKCPKQLNPSFLKMKKKSKPAEDCKQRKELL